MGQNDTECLNLPTPTDPTDTETIGAFIDNCVACGKFASMAAVPAACSELTNNCRVPSGDLPDPVPEDGMASESATMAEDAMMAENEDMTTSAGALNATLAIAAIEAACAETLMDTCVSESLAQAMSGGGGTDCAKVLVLGPNTEVGIIGCSTLDIALEIFNESAANICMAAASGG